MAVENLLSPSSAGPGRRAGQLVPVGRGGERRAIALRTI